MAPPTFYLVFPSALIMLVYFISLCQSITCSILSTALLAPTKHTQDLFQTSTSKSPRRMLLTRRAIDMSKKPFPRTMSHDSIKLGTNTKRNSTGGAPGSCPTRPGMAQQKTIIVGGSGGKTMYKTMRNISSVCHCYQQPSVCSFCLAR